MNILILGLAALSLYSAPAYGDSLSSDTAQLQAIEDSIVNMSSRVPGSAYSIKDSTGIAKTTWPEDFFNIFKYYELRRDEREAYFFYMDAPSQSYFTTIFSTARQNYMFMPPFSYYDGITGLSKTVENNYLYIYKMDAYNELIKPNFITSEALTEVIDPTVSTSLPRSGTSFQTGDNIFDELIRVSAIQDLVYKHFYLYCAEGDSTTCEAVMSATSKGFSSSGSADFSGTTGSTTRPNADINPESLLASPSFAIDSSGHHSAKDFIRMIANPTPRMLVPFKPDTSTDAIGTYIPDTSDIKQIGDNLKDSAYRNLSAYVLNDIKNSRLQSIDPKNTTTSTGGSLSHYEFLHNLAMNRMLTSNNWLAQMNVTSSEGLLREMVLIQASALMLQHQQFRQNENIEALLAAIVAQNQNLIEAMNFTGDMSKVQDSLAAAG